jgi:hypothetical protein
MLYRAYLLFVCLSIISCAISVSLSQLFLVLSFVCFLFLKEKPNFLTEILLILILFYSWQLASFFYHAGASEFSLGNIALAWKGEMKDIFLLSAFFVIQGVKKEDKPKITKAFQIFAYIILVTGIIAVFSPIRLSRVVSDLYRTSPTWPYQHHYGSFMGIDLYLPIGLMNTHLTFGGLLSFVFPYFFFSAYESWKKNEPIIKKLCSLLFLVLLSIVFLLNNARSSMLGAFFSISLGIYILIFIEKEISKKIIKYLTSGLTFLVFVFTIAYFQSSALQKVIQPLFGSEKHTDSGRTFIWDSTFPLISENPIFGIGPGAYPKEIEISRKKREVAHPELAYFYEVTQRGHSHNDYFHLAAIYGLPSALFYFLLGGMIVYGFSSGKISKEHLFISLGLSGFFLSGLLQCYFQDDEVLIVFFFLLGYNQMFMKRTRSSL